MNNILEYLEASAEKYPEKTAISDKNCKITFAELRSKVKRLAALLVQTTAAKGRAVAVIANRTADTAVSFLGVAASGNYYVAIDPEAPTEKINAILADSEAVCIIGREENRVKALDYLFGGAFIAVDILPEKEYTPDYTATQEDTPLYMVYTSGSTGKPKGILKSHGAYINYIDSFQQHFQIENSVIIGNQTPFFFDASAKDLYLMLKIGATLEILPQELFMFPVKLIQYMNERKISYISWVPSALSIVTQLNTFQEIVPEYLKYVFFVGEVFPMKQLNKWIHALPDLRYTNLYGSSEIAGVCCCFDVLGSFADDAVLPIGKALPGFEVFLIKDGKIIQSPNTAGEICISGKSLALCYYHDEEKTGKSFVRMQVPSGKVSRCFLTGDLAYYDENGNLVFVSRKDFQIKHMGHRIELGEIETAANALEGIQRTCCLYHSLKNKIVLFCQLSEDSIKTRQDILAMLKGRLSSYMLPNKIVIMDRLPLNANGKIDRQELKNHL